MEYGKENADGTTVYRGVAGPPVAVVPPMAGAPPEKFEAWATIELFGHNRIAGKVTEQTIGGCNFLRVDVPAVKDVDGELQGFTKLYGQGAIYAMTIVTEQVARSAVLSYRVQPVTAFELRPALGQLPSPKPTQRSFGYDPGDEGQY